MSPLRSDILAGQAGVITGGSSGIGLAIATAAIAHGAHVTIVGRDRDKLAKAVDRLGPHASGVDGDVRDAEAVERCCSDHLSRHGRLDFLVNNAAGNFLCPLETMSENAFQSVTEIVLNGTFLWSKAVLPTMRQAGYGRIVNIGTTYSWGHGAMVAHSGAAKAAVVNLTRSIAVEWSRYGIRCNVVAPGPVKGTEGVRRLVGEGDLPEAFRQMMPVPRFAEPEEVAWVVLLLCSSAADYINGAVIPVDGGLSLVLPGLLPTLT